MANVNTVLDVQEEASLQSADAAQSACRAAARLGGFRTCKIESMTTAQQQRAAVVTSDRRLQSEGMEKVMYGISQFPSVNS